MKDMSFLIFCKSKEHVFQNSLPLIFFYSKVLFLPVYWSTSPGPSELPVGITSRIFGTWDSYKALKSVAKSFSTFGITFWAKLLQGRLWPLDSVQVEAFAQAIQ